MINNLQHLSDDQIKQLESYRKEVANAFYQFAVEKHLEETAIFHLLQHWRREEQREQALLLEQLEAEAERRQLPVAKPATKKRKLENDMVNAKVQQLRTEALQIVDRLNNIFHHMDQNQQTITQSIMNLVSNSQQPHVQQAVQQGVQQVLNTVHQQVMQQLLPAQPLPVAPKPSQKAAQATVAPAVAKSVPASPTASALITKLEPKPIYRQLKDKMLEMFEGYSLNKMPQELKGHLYQRAQMYHNLASELMNLYRVSSAMHNLMPGATNLFVELSTNPHAFYYNSNAIITEKDVDYSPDILSQRNSSVRRG